MQTYDTLGIVLLRADADRAPTADEGWSATELVAFGHDLSAHGVRVLSIGGLTGTRA